MKCINIYCISSQHLDNRKKYFIATLNKLKELANENGLECHLHSISSPSHDIIENNMEDYNKRLDYSKSNHDKEDIFNDLIFTLNPQHISNIEKHREVLKIISSNDNELNLIIEDDVLTSKEYIPNIKELFHQLSQTDNKEWDLLITCIAENQDQNEQLKICNFKERQLVLKNKSSYFIKPCTAKRLYDFTEVIKHSFKHSLSKFIHISNVNVGILNKVCFVEGSKIGIFPSSINTENYLFQNREYVEISNIIRSNEITEEAIQKVENCFKIIENLPSPDISYIMGLFYYKIKDISKAKQYMTDACHKLKKGKRSHNKVFNYLE